VAFINADFLTWSTNGRYGAMLDVGMFHCLGEADIDRYLKQIGKLLWPGAGVYVMCIAEPPHHGSDFPRPREAAELTEMFSAVCVIDGIERVRDESTFAPEGFLAWLLKARVRSFPAAEAERKTMR
jgi:hypothetical protein